ncbi:MAG TPA: DinB family protein [Fibrobacteria bacterium]|nr:DinB family protein [Fibrobacteria bacterium]
MTLWYAIPAVERVRGTLSELSRAGGRLAELFEDLSNWERLWRPDPGAWNCMGHLAHLVDVELVYSVRIRSALAEPGRRLESFDAEAWVESQACQERTPEDLLETFCLLRRGNLNVFSYLTEAQWEQVFLHPQRGPQTISQISKGLLAHDAQHLLELGRLSELAREARRIA